MSHIDLAADAQRLIDQYQTRLDMIEAGCTIWEDGLDVTEETEFRAKEAIGELRWLLDSFTPQVRLLRT